MKRGNEPEAYRARHDRAISRHPTEARAVDRDFRSATASLPIRTVNTLVRELLDPNPA